MQVFIHVKKEDVELCRISLQKGNINCCIVDVSEWTIKIPEGDVILKITTKSAARMFNAGGIVNSIQYTKERFPKN